MSLVSAWLRLLVVCSVLPLVTSCATTAAPAAMTAAPSAAAVRPEPKALEVIVSGSRPGLEASDFKEAIEKSLANAGLGKAAASGRAAEYQLLAQIVELERPFAMARITASLEVAWSLLRASDKAVTFRKVIKSTHTGGAFDAFAGVVRVRMAIEAAAKNNIEELLS